MQLIKRTRQNRRDFSGLYECEKCKQKQIIQGYDDRNFHDNVAPNIPCDGCGETTITLCMDVVSVPTRYGEHAVI